MNVAAVTNDALGCGLWKVGEDGVELITQIEVNGQCTAVPAVRVFGPRGQLLALTILGPGMTLHYAEPGA